ncbi:MAG: hypothetical protein WBW88_11465 [Rhodothermales bacterium]|jgi:hypothetical protein
MRHSISRVKIVALVVALVAVTGCQTMKGLEGFLGLGFAIAGATDPSLAGVDISSIRSPEQMSTADMLRLGSALLRKEMNLDVILHVAANNPSGNTVDARVLGLDWVLLLDDRETISGVTKSDILIPPGTTGDIPVVVSVNLAEFFDTGVTDLIDLALAVSDVSGSPKRVKLKATPTIDTVLGPIRYPEPITIVSATVGE